MLLKVGSLLLVILLLSYSFFHFYRNKERISGAIGIVSSLLVGVSSTILSFLLMQTTNYNLALSILISIFYIIGSGLLVGRIFKKETGLHEILSGILGSTIGTVIGYMTFISNKPFLIVDILFILFIYIFLMLFDKQIVAKPEKKISNKKKKKTSFVPTIILTGTIFVIFILVISNLNLINVGMIGQPQLQTTSMDEENNLQSATIHITPSGFDPKNTIVTAKTMIKLNFNVDSQSGTPATLVSNDLQLHVNLKAGDNVILLDNPLKGTYHFMLDHGNFAGFLTVK